MIALRVDATDNPFRFSTKWFDNDTGLGYWGYRWYGPGMGRWINRDPIEEEGGINLLVFVFNDALNGADYLGSSTLSFCERKAFRVGFELPRVLSTTDSVSGVETTYLYDDLGEQIGQTRHGVTSASETDYQYINGEWWRVATQRTYAGAVTSSVSTTRQQLTGLSDALRSRSVGIAANGTITTQTSVFNPQTLELTTTHQRDIAEPSVSVSKFGRPIHSRTLHEATHNLFGPRGRIDFSVTYHPVIPEVLHYRWSVFNDYGDVYYDSFYGDRATGRQGSDTWQ